MIMSKLFDVLGDFEQVAAVERVVDTITLCSARDRTTAKHLEQLMDVCTSPALHTPYSTRRLVHHEVQHYSTF